MLVCYWPLVFRRPSAVRAQAMVVPLPAGHQPLPAFGPTPPQVRYRQAHMDAEDAFVACLTPSRAASRRGTAPHCPLAPAQQPAAAA